MKVIELLDCQYWTARSAHLLLKCVNVVFIAISWAELTAVMVSLMRGDERIVAI